MLLQGVVESRKWFITHLLNEHVVPIINCLHTLTTNKPLSPKTASQIPPVEVIDNFHISYSGYLYGRLNLEFLQQQPWYDEKLIKRIRFAEELNNIVVVKIDLLSEKEWSDFELLDNARALYWQWLKECSIEEPHDLDHVIREIIHPNIREDIIHIDAIIIEQIDLLSNALFQYLKIYEPAHLGVKMLKETYVNHVNEILNLVIRDMTHRMKQEFMIALRDIDDNDSATFDTDSLNIHMKSQTDSFLYHASLQMTQHWLNIHDREQKISAAESSEYLEILLERLTSGKSFVQFATTYPQPSSMLLETYEHKQAAILRYISNFNGIRIKQNHQFHLEKNVGNLYQLNGNGRMLLAFPSSSISIFTPINRPDCIQRLHNMGISIFNREEVYFQKNVLNTMLGILTHVTMNHLWKPSIYIINTSCDLKFDQDCPRMNSLIKAVHLLNQFTVLEEIERPFLLPISIPLIHRKWLRINESSLSIESALITDMAIFFIVARVLPDAVLVALRLDLLMDKLFRYYCYFLQQWKPDYPNYFHHSNSGRKSLGLCADYKNQFNYGATEDVIDAYTFIQAIAIILLKLCCTPGKRKEIHSNLIKIFSGYIQESIHSLPNHDGDNHNIVDAIFYLHSIAERFEYNGPLSFYDQAFYQKISESVLSSTSSFSEDELLSLQNSLFKAHDHYGMTRRKLSHQGAQQSKSKQLLNIVIPEDIVDFPNLNHTVNIFQDATKKKQPTSKSKPSLTVKII